MNLKRLLKRGALLAAANWQTVAIQFVAQTTLQVLLAVPITGAALLVAVLLGRDVTHLFGGPMRDMFTTVVDALTSEPVAFAAFFAAFGIALIGGSVLMFVVKGGTVAVLLDASGHAGAVEAEPITYESLKSAARFTMEVFLDGCARYARRYLTLGLLLWVAYVVTGAVYLAFVVFGYRLAEDYDLTFGWTVVAALSAVLLLLWITVINLAYVLLQMVMATQPVGVSDALRIVVRFARAHRRSLGEVFIVALAMDVTATLVSALAWSGVGLIAFVPLVGLAVFPLQILALVIRGLVFEYIRLTALGAYLTLYRRFTLSQPAGRASLESESAVPSIG